MEATLLSHASTSSIDDAQTAKSPISDAPPCFHLLAKPSGSTCNIDCKYCFFLSKEALYPNEKHRMSQATLEAYIRQLLESHRTPEVTVAWQGGEPTLMKVEFFRHAVELVEKYRRPGQSVKHTFQTNGILLDDEWCEFFRQYHFLVGLSVDGPRELHDTFRVDRRAQGTFDLVMGGWNLLRKHGVEFNILCTVNSANQHHGRSIYRFFRDELGARWIQFIPIIERATEQTIQLANRGWSERAGHKRVFVYTDRQSCHRAFSRREAIWSLPYGCLRGVGAPRRRTRLCATVRRDARGLLRSSSVVHPRPDLWPRPRPRVQRRSIFMRPLCRTRIPARQYSRNAHAQAHGIARTAQVWTGQARLAYGPVQELRSKGAV